LLELNKKIPSLVKYMGSKSEIIEYVVKGLNEVHRNNQAVCDLFAGSSTLAGALRNNNIEYISNDIQIYSSVFTNTYLLQYDWDNYPSVNEIVKEVEILVEEWREIFSYFWDKSNYDIEFNLESFNEIELFQQSINTNEEFLKKVSINENAKSYHLFMKEYSGTYWNFKQCLWIDAFRCIADRYKNIEPLYNLILSCTMYAMAYNSQSTGHYAQYRKADKESSMNDILIYRRKNMKDFFIRKFNEIKEEMGDNNCKVNTYSLSFDECIEMLNNGTLVYADPPYCSVHYSRFYHILETFIRYDYPEIKFGGRYRTDRHQSPFCISKQVRNAFQDMFIKLKEKECELVLSYSNSSTCMIELEAILLDSFRIFNNIELDEKIYLDSIKNFILSEEEIQIKSQSNITNEIDININNMFVDEEKNNFNYEITLKMFEHMHSTMGRADEKSKEVLEILVIVKKRNR